MSLELRTCEPLALLRRRRRTACPPPDVGPVGRRRPRSLTDLWVEGGSSYDDFGCDGAVYGDLNVGEGERCGLVYPLRHVCAPGLACVIEGDEEHCARPAREGEACTDEIGCGPGLFCREGLCQTPTLGQTLGAPCAGYDGIETCDVRLGLACIDEGPEGPRRGRATEVGDRCRWDVPTCGEGLWCGGDTRCERASVHVWLNARADRTHQSRHRPRGLDPRRGSTRENPCASTTG